MAIRLTKNLKRIIAGQFKGGDPIGYLANVYGVSHYRIEQVIREALLAADNSSEIPLLQNRTEDQKGQSDAAL